MFTMKNPKLWAAVAAGAMGLVLAASTASAGDRHNDKKTDVRVGIGVNLGGGRGPRYEERRVKVWVEPVYRTVVDKVWIEPEYRTVSDRIWREPVVRIQSERVWVPDRYEWRWTYRQDAFGVRIRVRERVLVERGHYENRESRIVVKPGCWETTTRQELVVEGRFDRVERREIVTPGHFEWRTERVAVDRGRRDTVVGFGVDWDLD